MSVLMDVARGQDAGEIVLDIEPVWAAIRATKATRPRPIMDVRQCDILEA